MIPGGVLGPARLAINHQPPLSRQANRSHWQAPHLWDVHLTEVKPERISNPQEIELFQPLLRVQESLLWRRFYANKGRRESAGKHRM